MDKKGYRLLGIDDSHFNRNEKFSYLVGCVVRQNSIIEGFLIERIEIDGLDSTEKIIKIIKNKRFYQQIKAVFLAGITFAGFNVADIKKIFEETKKPIIVLMKEYPNFNAIENALKRYFLDWEERLKIIRNAGEIKKIDNFFVQLKGIDEKEAEELIKISRKNSKIPEALRIAHMVASAISLGYSSKKVL
ncbi:MAG: DUF99 family protein [Candidatus Aenigmatarchaeota archaeon]